MNLRRKLLELRWNDQVGETVEDDVNLDALACFAAQGFHKAAAELVSFPDKGFEKDMLAGVLYFVEHRLVELHAVRVDLQPAIFCFQLYLGLVGPRETLARLLAALAELAIVTSTPTITACTVVSIRKLLRASLRRPPTAARTCEMARDRIGSMEGIIPAR